MLVLPVVIARTKTIGKLCHIEAKSAISVTLLVTMMRTKRSNISQRSRNAIKLRKIANQSADEQEIAQHCAMLVWSEVLYVKLFGWQREIVELIRQINNVIILQVQEKGFNF